MTISRKVLIVVLILFVFGLACRIVVDMYDLDEKYPIETQSQSSFNIDTGLESIYNI